MTDKVLCVCAVVVVEGLLGKHADASAAGEGEGLANSELRPHHHTLLRLKCFGGNWIHWGCWTYSSMQVGRLDGLFIRINMFSRVSRIGKIRRAE